MKATRKLLTVYCPGCDHRDDFINPPIPFKRLCACGTYWTYDRSGVHKTSSLDIPTSPENGSTTTPEKGITEGINPA